MPGSRSEIPENRLIVLRQQREAVRLVLRPCANVRGGEIAHVVHVETQQRSHGGFCQQVFGFLQAFAAKPVEIDSAFPIHSHGPVSFKCHDEPSSVISDEQRAMSGRLSARYLNAHCSVPDLPHIFLAASNTACSVGTVISSSGGENGMGTCMAPMRFTGASRS